MHPSIEQLLKVQDVDSEMLFVKESLRLRPGELDGDRRKVLESQRELEALASRIQDLRMQCDRKEVDVRKADDDIEKFNIALNQAKSNQEYTVIKEQIKRQEEARSQAEEDVLSRLTQVDGMEEERRGLEDRLAADEKALERKTAEVEQIMEGLRGQLEKLEEQRKELVDGVDRDHLRVYERVLARHNNFAIVRVEDKVCQGCFISVTAQEVNLLMQDKFVQCRSCSRILYLS